MKKVVIIIASLVALFGLTAAQVDCSGAQFGEKKDETTKEEPAK